MPSKRRSNHPQPAGYSDYDTEVVPYTNVDLPPRTIPQMNHSVLSKYVPGLQEIIAVAPFTVIYVFSPESQQWEKSGIEGSLFLCQLADGDAIGYAVVVLNRKSLDNFITHLTSADDVELTDEYVILQSVGEDGEPKIYGLWIFSELGLPTTQDPVGLAIQDCAVKAIQPEEQLLLQQEPYKEEQLLLQQEPYEEREIWHTAQQPAFAQQAPTGQAIDLASLFSKPQIQQETHIERKNGPPAQGQQIDLVHLFKQPQIQAENHIPSNHYNAGPQAYPQQYHNSNPHPAQQHPAQPPSQQTTLLNLFKPNGKG